jgi:nucleoside-diphosphate-sugar epimerase
MYVLRVLGMHLSKSPSLHAFRTDMKYKRMADLDLYARKSLRFTIIRPGGLTDEESNGKCELGRPQLGQVVSISSRLTNRLALSNPLFPILQSRETVAETILAVMLNKSSYGQVWDLMDGPTPIKEALEKAIEGNLSSWHD